MKGLPAILALAALISATLPAVPLATPGHAALAMAPASFEFELNRGQAPEGDYIAHGPGYTLALTATEMTLRVRRAPDPTLPKTSHGTTEAILRLRLVGARPDAIGAGLEQRPGWVNHVRGEDPSAWCTGIPTYAKVRFAGVYPGVDVIYHGAGQAHPKYDFVVAPGADPGVIALRFEDAIGLAVDRHGDLVLRNAAGELRQARPHLYQQGPGGVQQAVPGGYVVRHDGREVGFAVGPYDAARPLVIDPTLVYATYLGGNGSPSSPDKDKGLGIAVDAAGHAYVTGATNARGHWHADAFVMKFDPTGRRRLYATYLDGSGWDDSGEDIAVDAAGQAYVTGAFGHEGAFAAKLDAAGVPRYVVRFGGNPGYSLDFGADIAVDSAGDAYVTGAHMGALGPFPTTPGAFQRRYGGGDSDAFVVKLNARGQIVYATLLGGGGGDVGSGIAVDAHGRAYVTGWTDSRPPTAFPTTQGSFQPRSRGDTDAFVAKLNAAGSGLVYATHLGGRGGDQAFAIALDGAGHAYLAGRTAAPGPNDFPIVNAFRSRYACCQGYSFVAKLNAAGAAPIYSTYLSGVPGWRVGDAGYGIAVDARGQAHVTGETNSPPEPGPRGGGFPLVNPLQPRWGGMADAFVIQVGPTGRTLVHSTYLGGRYADVGADIAVDARGRAYVTGRTHSDDFPLRNAFQRRPGSPRCRDVYGCPDAFLAKVE